MKQEANNRSRKMYIFDFGKSQQTPKLFNEGRNIFVLDVRVAVCLNDTDQ